MRCAQQHFRRPGAGNCFLGKWLMFPEDFGILPRNNLTFEEHVATIMIIVIYCYILLYIVSIIHPDVSLTLFDHQVCRSNNSQPFSIQQMFC